MQARRRRTVAVAVLGTILGVAGSQTRAAEPGETRALLGAAEVIARVQAASAAAATTTNLSGRAAAWQALKGDLSTFSSNSAALPPAAAATQWLALYDRFWTLPTTGDEDEALRSVRRDVGTVLEAMPEPPAWEALLAAVEARPKADPAHADREILLRLFAHYLNGQYARCLEDIKLAGDAFAANHKNTLGGEDYTRRQYRQSEGQLRRYLLDLSGERRGKVEAFERQIDEQADAKDKSVQLRIPDLLTFADTNTATRLVEKALKLPVASIDVDGGDAMQELVRAAVLRNLDTLKSAPWNLVDGTNTVVLYETLTRRFPPKAEKDTPDDDVDEMVRQSGWDGMGDGWGSYGRLVALSRYVDGLLACGRTEDAIQTALDPNNREALGRWSTRRHERQNAPDDALFVFWNAVLTRNPDLPVWTELAAAGLALRRADEILVRLRAAAAVPAKSNELASDFVSAFLGLDAVDDALGLLRRAASAELPAADASLEQKTRQVMRAQNAAVTLMKLGRLLEHPEWIDEGLAQLRRWSTKDVSTSSYVNASSVEELIKCQRYADAETRALEDLSRATLEAGRRRGWGDDSSMLLRHLQQLVDVYAAADRPADVVAVVEGAPWWGAADLRELRSWSLDADFVAKVAKALLAVGRKEEALSLAREAVRRSPGTDAAYAVIVQQADANTLAWLDRQYARNRFEERPLIWKATVLLKLGRLDEAEATIREALKVDPTDGETAAGDRVRGYGVLAEVLAARGKTEDAAFFRNVVESVRVAERGDDLKQAGLLQRSLAAYEQASGLFFNAYCVQWRLAERCWAAGRRDEAAKHYAIAFERMPEQFGQLAQLCFGCQGIFDQPQSRNIAETVLARLEQNGPPRPQVQFLLGQLREAQGQPAVAYRHYLKSVEVDPGYMDGWKRLDDLAKDHAPSQAERDRITLALLTLDPLCQNFTLDVDRVANLRGLWNGVKTSLALWQPPPATLLPLPASRKQFEETKKLAQRGDLPSISDYTSEDDDDEAPSPGAIIAKGGVVRKMVELQEALALEATREDGELPASHVFFDL